MIVNIFNKINLDDKKFREVDLKSFNDFYLIGYKKNDEIKSIVFEVAIDSGIKNNPLYLPNIKLDLDKEVSGVRVLNHPSVFYIRPIQVIKDHYEVVEQGKYDIDINVNALDLG